LAELAGTPSIVIAMVFFFFAGIEIFENGFTFNELPSESETVRYLVSSGW